MLESTKIQKRQSEIRESLAGLAGKESPDENEVRQMTELDTEYRNNETRYRAALVSEDTERRDAGADLENREASEWSDLVGKYEVRQAALFLDEGRQLDGATAEVVSELRQAGGYRGIPVPFEALEQRAGETIATGAPDPIQTRPIIDRLFPSSVASAMGAQMVNVGAGQVEYPVTTSNVSAGWASSETGDVASPTAYSTADSLLKPEHNLGVQMKMTRRSLKQSGGIEQAVRRDMRNAISAEMDKATFQGSGASGQPLGVIAGATTYNITETSVGAAATWGAFRSAVTDFMVANAIAGPNGVRVLIRPEIYDGMDGAVFDSGSGITEFDRLNSNVGTVAFSSNALTAPSGSPAASKALLTTGQPIFVATWGGIDLIRDPYSDAASGGLRITGLITLDITISRSEQLQVLSGLQ